VVLPEGTMLSAKPPSALGLWSIALPTVIDTILKALAPAVPHLVPAAHKGDMGGCSFFGFRDDGSRFLLMNIFGGGWGGRPTRTARTPPCRCARATCATRRSSCRRSSHPVLVETHALRCGFRRRRQTSRRARSRTNLSASAECKANINLDRTRDPP
jgi:N-methylhydantoinase B